ncbi:hypothetical protein BAUCODRAFT_545966 [Baudoinia panamericana UAMH 10762]|uniref:Very long-chain fatty acid transport protein n=1 Tax=Baudoinia panamericana (strain UAMH 10762) TaxID=717646 RepID=M2MS81_BAUPA|nr:uncharacterized protein BAUCODRAFT_545966 [Baudoinia panamericana UAMH 10762]EMC94363.1 hypothetical protein BAUCODRAFT_545966 [Baudoinia panamericana UAMH 10762]
MALATAAVAGTAAAAAYLDGRYHLAKDIGDIRERRRVGKLAQKQAKQHRLSLWYLFEEQAQKLKDEQCIWYRSNPSEPITTYTWTQTYEQCCRWANFLLEQGVKPGELVGTYLVNTPEFMFNLVGSWAIGSAPAMINYNLGGDGLIHSLKVSGSKVLVVDEDEGCQERVEAVRSKIESELDMKIVIINAATKAAIAARPSTRPADSYRKDLNPNFPIFLFYTSGTTGLPKACAMPTARSYVLTSPRLRSTGVKAGRPRTTFSSGRKPDVWYDCMPLYHGTGCTVALSCLINGVTLAIGRKFSVRNFWRDVHDSQANAFVYVGETARYLLAAPPSPLDKGHKLKAMYGNGMRPDVWSKFQERFDIPCVNEFFNSTEGMLQLLNVCRGPFHAAHVGHHGALERRRLWNKIVPVQIDYEKGDQIWRDPKTGFAKRQSYEEGGEVLIKCDSEKDFVGYWNNPDATQRRFEKDVFQTGDLYYRTGDALRRDADGRWFFLDRLGDTFRWKSENVSTAEVAEVLGRFPGIVEANVYGVEIPNHDGRAGCAAIFIQPADPEHFDWTGLLAHARKLLPRYAVPVFLRVVRQQQASHNNKQLKVPLRKEGVDPKKVREGDAGSEDILMWVRPGSDRYEPFTETEWETLGAGKARL